MKIRFFFIFWTSIILIGCSTSQNLNTPEADTSAPSQAGTESAMLWQQSSAEYTALCLQAFNAAKLQLDNLFEKKGFSKSPVIIMDLDETVLDNSPYNAKLLLENTSYNEESWNAWVLREEAQAVPGAIDFIKYAIENDFYIIFVSNRSRDFLRSTMNNVNAFGFNFNEKNFALKGNTSEKIGRRRRISQDFEIIMLIGDNLADMSDAMDNKNLTVTERKLMVLNDLEQFGITYIVLPNVMYGNWQKALQLDDNESSYSKDQQEGVRKFLRSY